MGMNDTSLIDKINPTLIAHTTTAIYHCLSAWKTGEFRVPPEFGPGGGVPHKRDITNINHTVNNACTDVFGHLNADFHSSLPEVHTNKIGNIHSMIRQRIHSARMDPVMAQPRNHHSSFDEDLLDHVPDELIEQPNNSFNHLSSFVTASDVSMQYSAVRPIDRSAITSSSQPVPCSNCNSNNITNITST